MATATKDKKPQALLHLPLKEVNPDPTQPRKEFPDDEHSAFVENVRQWGVLTPITVRKNGKGYVIVAGERRYRAAVAAKLPTIPALVREGDDATTLIAATVENVMRLDLNPVEEGHAYKGILDTAGTAEKVAALVSRPLDRVESRLALTTLPEDVQEHVRSGAITLPAAAVLAVIQGKHGGEPLVQALTFGVVNGCYSASSLASDPGDCLRSLSRAVASLPCEPCNGVGWLDASGKGKPVPYADEAAFESADDEGMSAAECEACGTVGRIEQPLDVPDFTAFVVSEDRYAHGCTFVSFTEQEQAGWDALTERANTEQEKRAKANTGYGFGDYYKVPGIRLDPAVEGLAESLNALVRFGGRNGGVTAYVLDRDLVAEQLLSGHTATVEAWLALPKPKGSSSSGSSSAAGGSGLSDKEKADRKKEREQAAKDRVTGEGYNLDLGAAITTKLAEVKLTVDEARLIVDQLIRDHVIKRESYMTEKAKATGPAMMLRFLGEPAERTKAGKAVWPKRQDAIAPAVERIERDLKAAKTVEQVFGVLFRVLAAGTLTDRRGLTNAESEGCHFGFREEAGWRKALAKRLPPALIKKAPPARGW